MNVESRMAEEPAEYLTSEADPALAELWDNEEDELQAVTGGFGTIVGFAHDWANREATLRSWELFARYVAPELNGITAAQKGSAQFVQEHKTELGAGAMAAIMSKIQADEKAAAAFAVTLKGMQERTGTGFRPGFTETPDDGAKVEAEPTDAAGS